MKANVEKVMTAYSENRQEMFRVEDTRLLRLLPLVAQTLLDRSLTTQLFCGCKLKFFHSSGQIRFWKLHIFARTAVSSRRIYFQCIWAPLHSSRHSGKAEPFVSAFPLSTYPAFYFLTTVGNCTKSMETSAYLKLAYLHVHTAIVSLFFQSFAINASHFFPVPEVQLCMPFVSKRYKLKKGSVTKKRCHLVFHWSKPMFTEHWDSTVCLSHSFIWRTIRSSLFTSTAVQLFHHLQLHHALFHYAYIDTLAPPSANLYRSIVCWRTLPLQSSFKSLCRSAPLTKLGLQFCSGPRTGFFKRSAHALSDGARLTPIIPPSFTAQGSSRRWLCHGLFRYIHSYPCHNYQLSFICYCRK